MKDLGTDIFADMGDVVDVFEILDEQYKKQLATAIVEMFKKPIPPNIEAVEFSIWCPKDEVEETTNLIREIEQSFLDKQTRVAIEWKSGLVVPSVGALVIRREL